MFQKTTFPNGLRLITAPMPHTRTATVMFFFGAGARYERDEEAGISHFIEHMVFKGTARRPTPKEVSEQIEGVGGVLNAVTDHELTAFWAKAPRPSLENTVDCLADMVRNSLFDPRELEKERQVIIEELNMVADSPQQLASLLIDATLWPGQPLGRDVAGTKETVRSITRAMQLDYLARNYGPNNLVVSVAGNVTPEETEALVERLLGDWEPTTPSPMAPAVNGQHAPRVNLLSKRTEQAQVCLAIPAYDQSHPDQFALDVLNIILGEGMSSRLFIELRENRGLCYDVNSYAPRFRDTGALTVSAGVDPKRVDDAVRAIIEELWRFRTAPVSSRELQKAKDLVKGRLLMRMEDSRAVASSFGRQELLMGHILTADELTEIIDAVDSDDILRVANDLFHEERLNLAIVGNFRSEDRFRALLHA